MGFNDGIVIGALLGLIVGCTLGIYLDMHYVRVDRAQGPSAPAEATSEPAGHVTPPGYVDNALRAREALAEHLRALGVGHSAPADESRGALKTREAVSGSNVAPAVAAGMEQAVRETSAMRPYEGMVYTKAVLPPLTGLRPACSDCGRPVLKTGARLCLDCQPRTLAFPGV